MTPFYFGSTERRLFGIYESAAEKHRTGRAALLCHAWGMDYLISYRAMRFLASRLVAAGIDVLRFDYFGTGDSGGETVEADLFGCLRDIETASGELLGMSQARSTIVIGLRLGATLVAQAAQSLPNPVGRTVLWDPIRLGSDYIVELSGRARRAPSQASGRQSDQIEELDGLQVSGAFVFQLRALDLAALPIPENQLRLIIETSRGSSHAESGLSDRVSVVNVPSAPVWFEEKGRVGALPADVAALIINWLQ